jgi:hypothetical protein
MLRGSSKMEKKSIVKFKPLNNKFKVILVLVLLFISLVPNVVTAQGNFKVVFDETRLQKSGNGFGYEGQISENAYYGESLLQKMSFKFIPKSEGIRVISKDNFEYRIPTSIVVSLLLFIGVIFKIRRDEKPSNIKPIEKWKVMAISMGYILAFSWNFFLFLVAWVSFNPELENYDPTAGYMLFLTSIPFGLITAFVLYNLLIAKRILEKYIYLNIFLCVFSLLYSVFFEELFIGHFLKGDTIPKVFILIFVPLFLPNFFSLLTVKVYGRELIIKGEEFKALPKPFKAPLKPLLPDELKRKYQDVEYIGEGGFAWVFSATRKDGKKVAIKIPKNLDEKTGWLFIREVSNWSTLDHENIVKLYDCNVYPVPYFEMELCDGSLQNEKLSVEKAVGLVLDIARGLRYAHERKIIHGDLKLSNILMKHGRVKISDWGLSKVKTEKSVSLSGITPSYSAPEQISHEFGKADERTDIWQLGVVFYELVTGKLPFEGDLSKIYVSILQDQPIPPSEINQDSKSIEHIIMKCLRKRKEERYQSMDELIEDLKKYAGEIRTMEMTTYQISDKTILKKDN